MVIQMTIHMPKTWLCWLFFPWNIPLDFEIKRVTLKVSLQIFHHRLVYVSTAGFRNILLNNDNFSATQSHRRVTSCGASDIYKRNVQTILPWFLSSRSKDHVFHHVNKMKRTSLQLNFSLGLARKAECPPHSNPALDYSQLKCWIAKSDVFFTVNLFFYAA